MPSVFTRILRGELPGRFVWRDAQVAAFLTIEPLRPGHTLVVPLVEVDHWQRLDPGLAAHLMHVAQQIGLAIERAFAAQRVGLMVAGLEVPHVHLHVSPIETLGDLDFANVNRNAKPAELDAVADKLRAALRELGRSEVAE